MHADYIHNPILQFDVSGSTRFVDGGAIQRIHKKELTDIESVTSYSDYFELDLHSFGTKFTNTGIYQAIRDCNLLQLQKCIQYGTSFPFSVQISVTILQIILLECITEQPMMLCIPCSYCFRGVRTSAGAIFDYPSAINTCFNTCDNIGQYITRKINQLEIFTCNTYCWQVI